MGNTCSELLEYCLRDETPPPALLDRAISDDDGRKLFSVVVEKLGDLFEPRLAKAYARLFSDVIARVAPDLRTRLRANGTPRPIPKSVERAYVLSRVTLGADVAVTSVLLDAAKRRFPDSEIVFVAPRKSLELFEADAHLRPMEAAYARGGTLEERLRASAALWFDDGIVIDPDSRLTQLGLISVCEESGYFHFPSRSYESNSNHSLSELASRWAQEVLGVDQARPYIAPRPPAGPATDITVSLGVGENSAKRLSGDFERDLFRMLARTGASVLVDKGGTPEERTRVECALQSGMQTHDGAFAPFAAEIARSKFYTGYDSAGGHVASACGIPQVCIFTGAVSERFFHRWKPRGTVLRGEDPNLMERLRAAIAELRPSL